MNNTKEKWIDKIKAQKKGLLLCALGVVAAALFPVIFMWSSNAGIATFQQAAGPMLAYLGGGLALYVVMLLITASAAKSGLVAMLGLLLFSNYAFIETGLRFVIRPLQYWHVVGIVLALGVTLSVLVVARMKPSAAATVLKFASIAFAGLVLFNFVMLVPSLLKGGGQPDDTASTAAQGGADRQRNFYYFIFDEYGNNPFMEKYYSYDNSSLTGGLEERGFSVSYDSSSECASTLVITTNILNLGYVADLATYRGGAELRSTIEEQRRDNKVFGLMRERGYEIVGLSHPEYYGLDAVTSTVMDEGVTASGQTFKNLLLDNTPLYPLNNVSTDVTADNVRETFDYLMEPEHFADGSKFVITHLMLPHPPFVFDKNGGLVSANNYNNWDDKQYYLGQHQYTSKMMLELADSIIANDPDAVIIFSSDHSARASTREGDADDPMFELIDRARCFQAVYMGGQAAPDIEGKSGLNVMVTVLNEMLGTDFDEVPYRLDPDFL